MFRFALAALAISAGQGAAADLSCRDAAAFYHYAMFTSKMFSATSGACAQDISQPACVTVIAAVKENDADLTASGIGDPGKYLAHLKAQCPEDIPDNPGEF